MYKNTLRRSLIGMSFLLALVLSSVTFGQDIKFTSRTATREGATKVGVCHATEAGTFELLMLPPGNAVDVHIADPANPDSGHDDDYLASASEIAAGQCGDSGGPGPTPQPGGVPEPVTMLLFGAGLAGVGYASRKLRRKKS